MRRSPPKYCYPVLPLDLHVLSLSLAFILSQDQTLRCCLSCFLFFKIDKTTFCKFVAFAAAPNPKRCFPAQGMPFIFSLWIELTEPNFGLTAECSAAPSVTSLVLLRILMSLFQSSRRFVEKLVSVQLGKVTAKNTTVQILFKILTIFKAF